MEKCLITVVIPFYNEENNIKKCLESLNLQTCKNFRVVLVDDGSIDGSLKIAEKIKNELDFKIEIHTQENKGAAEAKKTGILNSCTDFVMILDCDDLISIDAIENLQKSLLDNQPDIILFKLHSEVMIRDQVEVVEFNFFTQEKNFSGYDALKNSIDGWGVHASGCYRKSVFLKSYNDYSKYNIDNINYLNNDEVITKMNFSNAKSIEVIDSIYYYKFNLNSTTKKLNFNRFKIMYNAFLLCDFIEKEYPRLKVDSSRHLISTFWGVSKYLRENKDILENRNDWSNSIRIYYKLVRQRKLFFDLDFKRKIQYFLLFTLFKPFN